MGKFETMPVGNGRRLIRDQQKEHTQNMVKGAGPECRTRVM